MANIVQLTLADEKVCEEINAVLRQLNKNKTCTLDMLRATIESPTTEVWVAKDGDGIVGAATLALAVRLGGLTARLEDVVVDESQRGKGVGKALCEKIVERARQRGARSLHLTSRPEREAANRLYQKLGFELRETNSYKLEL